MGKKKKMKPLFSKVYVKKIWGFDIETYGEKNDFLMGSIVGDFNVNKTFWDNEKFINYILDNATLFRNGFIYATNLQFDILSLLKGTKYLKFMKPLIKNSSFIHASIETGNRNRINFADTFNYCRISVERMGKLIGIEKLDRPDFLGRIPKNNNERLYLEEYNLRDSLISYRFMKMLQENFNRMNAELKLTSASTSMDLYRRNYQKREFFQPLKHELLYLYNGYYGGRTEAVKRGHVKNLRIYDVNSLYPSVMCREYPVPTRFKYVKYLRPNAINENEGVARCKLIMSDNIYMPYLPVRIERKLIFPVGVIEGYYTFFEIREALKLGYRLEKVYDAVIYFEKGYPFTDYVRKLYALRKKYRKKGDFRQVIIKLFLNSLYGKFAQKITAKEEIMHESRITKEILDKFDFDWIGEWFIIKKEYNSIPCFVNPIFSIYTTAYARDALYKFMQKVGFDNCYYHDTDSIFTSKYIETSDKLGDMKLEGKIKEGIIVKPKMYLTDEKVKCKGVHNIDGEVFQNILKTNKVSFKRFTKFKESLRRKLSFNQIIDIEKVLNLEDDKRLWREKFNRFTLQDSEPISI